MIDSGADYVVRANGSVGYLLEWLKGGQRTTRNVVRIAGVANSWATGSGMW